MSENVLKDRVLLMKYKIMQKKEFQGTYFRKGEIAQYLQMLGKCSYAGNFWLISYFTSVICKFLLIFLSSDRSHDFKLPRL